MVEAVSWFQDSEIQSWDKPEIDSTDSVDIAELNDYCCCCFREDNCCCCCTDSQLVVAAAGCEDRIQIHCRNCIDTIDSNTEAVVDFGSNRHSWFVFDL